MAKVLSPAPAREFSSCRTPHAAQRPLPSRSRRPWLTMTDLGHEAIVADVGKRSGSSHQDGDVLRHISGRLLGLKGIPAASRTRPYAEIVATIIFKELLSATSARVNLSVGVGHRTLKERAARGPSWPATGSHCDFLYENCPLPVSLDPTPGRGRFRVALGERPVRPAA